MVVARVKKMLLHRLVGAIGVADDDAQVFLDHRIETPLGVGRQTRDAARSANEDRRHRLLRVRVMVRTFTLPAWPGPRRMAVIAFIVAPERYRSSNRRMC